MTLPPDLGNLASRRHRRLPRAALAVAFLLGTVVAVGVFALLEGGTGSSARSLVDPRLTGLSWGWLAFGYGAQLLFTARMLVQWIATEKRRASVVPVVFWWLSLFGGLMLLAYFLRRGDPVGSVGQLFGAVVYVRNLALIYRRRRAEAPDGGSH